jgi:RNA polymerase-binding transcription factor DksA
MAGKAPAKKVAVKKAAAKKVAVKKAAPASKAPAKKVAVKKVAVKKAAPASKAPAKKVAVKKAAAASKAPAKKVAVKKAAAAKPAPAKPAPAKPAPAPTRAKPPALAKKPDPPKPKAFKYPFDAKFLEAQHALLHEERVRLVRDADSLTAEANALAELREPGDVQFDEESGEGDTLAVERERDLALSAQFRDQVDEIDRALLKIPAGTYGICEVSGLAIPRERLKAIPWCRERVEYKVGGFSRR